MSNLSAFDIIGPRMIGPSSSHTAGAARLGYMAWKLAGKNVEHAEITLYGSFARTGRGHGTDKALALRAPHSFLQASVPYIREGGRAAWG